MNISPKVEVVPYDSHWPEFFKQETFRIQERLGSLIKKIHHIGSTSISQMPAKPIIDMMLECDDISDIEKIKMKLETLGYSNLSRQVIPYRSFFTRKYGDNIGFHLHIYERGDPQIKRHVNFKDYMISHLEDAESYAALKLKLAEQFKEDIKSYVIGKDKLVQQIDAKAKLWSGRKEDFLPTNTGKNIKNLSNNELMKAMIANLNVHMTHFAQYLDQVELIRVPGMTIVNSGLPDDTFNYVLDADLSEAVAKEKITEITNYFKNKNLPFSWWVSPYDQPENLTTFLEENGYQNSENNIAMYFDLDSWIPRESADSKLTIVKACDEKTLQDFALVLTNDEESFKAYFSKVAAILTNEDPIEYYVGYVKGKPVVRGLSCYYAGVVGLHWLSTAPDERNKGYGRAMQEFRLKRAKELGYHIAVLQASSEGYSLYCRLGYKECGIFKEFKLRDNE